MITFSKYIRILIQFCKKKAVEDPDRKRADRETTRDFINAVEEAKAALKEEVLRKRRERLAKRAKTIRNIFRGTSRKDVKEEVNSNEEDASTKVEDKTKAEDEAVGAEI